MSILQRTKSEQVQRGFTLVELMVAMVIGLFIVLVAITIYTQGLSSFAFRVGQSENMSNSRYTIDTLGNEFAKAGYRRDPSQLLELAFPKDAGASASGCEFAAGQAIYAPTTTSLCMRYQARDSSEADCTGAKSDLSSEGPYVAPVTTGAGLLVEHYTLENGALVCVAGKDAATTVQVADGVSAVHFEFGVGNRGDTFAARRVREFKPDIPVGTDTIRALRYAVLVTSTGKVTQGMASTVCERWVAAGGDTGLCSTDSNRLLQLASGTLTLRNLMP